MESTNSEISIANRLDAPVIEEDVTQERDNSLRAFWLAWIAFFGLGGLASGAAALIISILTAFGLLEDNRLMSVVVAAMLMGSMGASLLSAHGLDQLRIHRKNALRHKQNEFNDHHKQ